MALQFRHPITDAEAPDFAEATAAAAADAATAAAGTDELRPRAYQDQLLEISLTRNTIIYLPTGAGKTFIALMAIKRMAADLTRPLAEGGRRSVFLVNTVVLANQQMEAIQKATSLRVAKYTGDMNVDAWRRDRWLDEFDGNQVLVATCQIILDVLRHGFLQLRHINLLIFDECHHGRSEHPMHQLMRLYSEQPAIAPRPRVIGLTGMLIGGSVRPESVVNELTALEATFHATISTVATYEELNNVLVYSTKPAESVLRFEDGPGMASEPLLERVRGMVAAMVALLERWPVNGTHSRTSARVQLHGGQLTTTPKFVRSLLNDFVYQYSDLGLYGASIAILAVIVELELKKRSAETKLARTLLRLMITGAERIRHVIVKELYDDGEEEEVAAAGGADDADTILTNSSPKMINFLMFMHSFCKKKRLDGDGEDLKGLVFVQRRHSAKCVFLVLQRYARSVGPESFGVRPDFMVGVNSQIPESVEAVLDNKWNREVVARFRRNDINVIVASSVLEEGVDLQECNLVVSLDAPQTFRSYVQSKGRARMQRSSYVIMVPRSGYSKLIVSLDEWQRVERVLRDYLIGKAVDRRGPLDEDIEREFGTNYKQYHTLKGAVLEEMSAVQLLNRYCATLPNDSFTPSTVSWTKSQVTGGAAGRKTVGEPSGPVMVRVGLRMPMQSTVKQVVYGEAKPSLKEAKRSAAYEACKLLHKAKELNDHLMPMNSRRCLEEVRADYFAHWQKHANDTARNAGTRNSLRFHTIVRPLALQNCNPFRATTCLLYKIRMEPAFSPTARADLDPTAGAVHALLASSRRCFGLLTAQPLPPIATIKLFQHFGAIVVRIATRPIRLPASSLSALPLRRAHEHLFRELIGAVRPFVIGQQAADNDYLIVPCKADAIDAAAVVQLAELHTAIDRVRVPSAAERAQRQYVAADYEGAVVTPCYRNDHGARYVVTRVCTDLSPFGRADVQMRTKTGMASFAEFVANRWGMHAVNRSTDFMLEVRGITQRMNLLVPGGDETTGGGSLSTARRPRELLIPELCHRFDVPGDLWLQATMLPSTLHRLEFALQAAELRCETNRALGIVTNEDYVPDALLERSPVVAKETEATTMAAPATGRTNPAAIAKAPASASPVLADPWSDLPVKENLPTPPVLIKKQPTVADPWSTDDLGDVFAHLDIVVTDVAERPSNLQPVSFVAHPWADLEEPTDVSRNLTDVYPVDLQYFNQFVDEHCDEVDQMTSTDLLHADGAATSTATAADRDVPPQHRIRLLEIKRTTPTSGPRQCDLMAALTASSSSDVFDGERLEVLGDAFLKFAASLFLLRRHIDWHEGHLSSCKGQLVSNRNLFYLAHEHRLGGRLKVTPFDPRSAWLPPAMAVPPEMVRAMRDAEQAAHLLVGFEASEEERRTGVVSAERINDFVQQLLVAPQSAPTHVNPATSRPMNVFLNQQLINDKVVADAVEACLGATLCAVGIDRTFIALRHWGVFPANASPAEYGDLLATRFMQPRLRSTVAQREIDDLLPNYPLLERHLGYAFRDRAYLLQALTHPSYPTNQLTGCYQQLEFIGDAVLDMLVTAHIYERCPHMQPGQLTDLRSALVNNITLACLCVRNHFHRFILAQNAVLAEQIARFVEFQRGGGHRVSEQVLLLIAEGEVRMGEHIDVPKSLGDVLEALVGAVFLDSGNDLERTWQVVYGLMRGELEAFERDTPVQVVRRLGEYRSAAATYDVPFVEGDVVMVTVRYTCRHELKQGHGFGRNARQAKNAAAKVALSDLLADG